MTTENTPIKTQRDYRRALKDIESLMAAKRSAPEGHRLDVLVTMAEAWERKRYPSDLSPITLTQSVVRPER